MSKLLKPFFFAGVAFLQILHLLNNCAAQSVEIDVRLDGAIAKISGTIKDTGSAAKVTNFSLLESYAGKSGLSRRHTSIRLFNDRGAEIAFRELAPGEFLAAEAIAAFSFRSDLKPIDIGSMARISWVAEERGLIVANDLVPRLTKKLPVDFRIVPPEGWRIANSPNSRLADPESATFLIGNSVRTSELPNRVGRVHFDGDFLFDDDFAAQAAAEIIDRYRALFGSIPADRAEIILIRYPKGTRFGRWEAETRGSNVVIASADMPFSTQSEQKIHEQLRHELFHLWIPNGLALDGNYDWFYEGFALYWSLRTAVELNRIRFDDFLDTLARAYDADSMLSVRRSLVEASGDRWSGANTHVYARGMLVAFLTDLALLSDSKTKRSVADLLRTVWERHREGRPRTDGNRALIAILEGERSLSPIVKSFVTGSETIEWRTSIAAAGIESRTENFATRLSVVQKPNGRQKQILDKLGYNNWRNFQKSSR